MKAFFIFLIAFGFLSFSAAKAANPLDIVINEAAWMGTDISANDEWIVVTN